MKDFKVLGEAYMDAARDMAADLREAAQLLRDGLMPSSGFEEKTRDGLQHLASDYTSCLASYEELAKEIDGRPKFENPVAVKVLLDNYEATQKTAAEPQRRKLLNLLTAFRAVQSDNPVYTAAVSPMIRKAEQICRKLEEPAAEDTTGLLPEHLDMAAQAEAVMDAIRQGKDIKKAEADRRFRELGIDTEILLGVLLGEYTLERADAEEAANAEEQASDASDAAESVDEIVHPTQKLPDRVPSAKVFLRVARKLNPDLVEAVLYSMMTLHLLTPEQVCASVAVDLDVMTPSLRQAIVRTMQGLYRNGILAMYEAADQELYLLTDYGVKSLQKREVRKQCCSRFPDDAFAHLTTAKQDMSLLELMIWWAAVEARCTYLLWYREVAGPGKRNGEGFLTREVNGMRRAIAVLPEAAGGGEYLLKAYEYAVQPDEKEPAIFVSVLADTEPMELVDRAAQDGDLLLRNGTLLERRDGAWVPRELTDAYDRSKDAARKTTGRQRHHRQ